MKVYEIDNALLIRALREANERKRERFSFFKRMKRVFRKPISRLDKEVYTTA